VAVLSDPVTQHSIRENDWRGSIGLTIASRAGAASAAALAASIAVLLGAIAFAGGSGPRVETLLESRTTVLGQPIAYPTEGAARITAVIVTLAPGAETGRHRHRVPLYGHVLSGQVTIDYEGRGSKTFKAGDAFMEAVGTWHNGRNSGSEPLRILAVYLGAEGLANSERP